MISHRPQSCQVVLQGSIVLVTGIVLDDRHDSMVIDEASQVVDVSIRVVTGNAISKPQDLAHTVIVAQVGFDLVSIEVRVAIRIEQTCFRRH